MKITITKRLPSVAEYNYLRSIADWPVIEENLVAKGLQNTLFAVVAKAADGKIVGMGRIVGDNALYLHVADVIVDPAYQRMGVGKMMMTDLMDYISFAGGKNTNVGLMCSKGREPFYKKFGFIARPNERFGAGMIIIK